LQQMSNIYLDQSDYQTALALCDQTEAILSGLPTLSDRQTWKLQIVQSTNHKLRCNAYQAVGDFEQARIALEQAMALDRANEDLRGEASCFLRRGIIARIQGKLDLAISAFERSMTLAKLTGYSRLQYLLKNSMALTYSDKGDNKTAQLFLEAYYDTAWEAGDLKSQLTGLINLGLTCARQGAYIAARDYDEKGLALARQLRNRWSEGLLLGNLGVVMMRIGDLSAADGLFTESLAARLEINDLPGEMYSRVYLARLAVLTAELETAVSQSRRVLDICQETPVRDVDHLARTTLGHVLLRQGDLAGARRRYREAVAGWDRSGREHLLLSPLSGLARIALIEDDVEQALNYCERILRQAPERDLESTFEPFDIWLICLQVLFAAADERAVTTLRAVVDELRERAAQFAIPAQQEQFLQHNPAPQSGGRLPGIFFTAVPDHIGFIIF